MPRSSARAANAFKPSVIVRPFSNFSLFPFQTILPIPFLFVYSALLPFPGCFVPFIFTLTLRNFKLTTQSILSLLGYVIGDVLVDFTSFYVHLHILHLMMLLLSQSVFSLLSGTQNWALKYRLLNQASQTKPEETQPTEMQSVPPHTHTHHKKQGNMTPPNDNSSIIKFKGPK